MVRITRYFGMLVSIHIAHTRRFTSSQSGRLHSTKINTNQVEEVEVHSFDLTRYSWEKSCPSLYQARRRLLGAISCNCWKSKLIQTQEVGALGMTINESAEMQKTLLHKIEKPHCSWLKNLESNFREISSPEFSRLQCIGQFLWIDRCMLWNCDG